MLKEYTTPAGTIYNLYDRMLTAGHILIAGATGSGKSTVIEGLLTTALYNSPAAARFVICDPKRVDMVEYAELPHTLCYAQEPRRIEEALCYTLSIMEDRYNQMARQRVKEYNGSTIYVVIDELADLLTDPANKRTFSPMIQRLAQLGRAARIVLVCATQCCLASILNTAIKCNFSSRLALRTATAQDSRNIIDMKGAETLPDPITEGAAYGIWRHGANIDCWKLPRYDESARRYVIDYWMKNSEPRIISLGRKSA